MSAKIMGQVWDYDLGPTDQAVLLALADHCDHNGENAYPSIALLAWKTGLSRRGVQGAMSRLRGLGAIVAQRGARFHYSTTYRIVLQSLPRKVPLPREVFEERGAPAAPLRGARGDKRGARGDKRGAQAVRTNRPRNRPTESSQKSNCGAWRPSYEPDGGLVCATCGAGARRHA